MSKQYSLSDILIPLFFLSLFCSLPATASANDLGDPAMLRNLLTETAMIQNSNTPIEVASNQDISSLTGRESMSSANDSEHFTASDYHNPIFSANKFHKYMGIGAVVMGAVTALSAPDAENEGVPSANVKVNDGFHQASAITATTMAVLATASGFLFHYKDLSLANGLTDPDNMHMMLGLLGTLGYVSAVANAPDDGVGGDGHSSLGIAGGASMLIGIKLEW